MIKKGFYFWQKAKIFHPGLKKIGLLMIPTIFGAAVYQINILVGTLLGFAAAQGSVSYLYYADRLVQFPLGIFAIATATAVLPSLSRQAAKKDLQAVRDTFSYAMKLVFFITIPSMVGLIVLREPIVALLFKRGAFDAKTTHLTAYALLYYSMGLWAFSAVRIVVSTFYALQDTKTPVRMAVSIGLCQYHTWNRSYGAHGTRWACTLHVPGFDVEPGTSCLGLEDKARRAGIENYY